MRFPVKDQASPVEITPLACDDREDKTRQEFRDEVDTMSVLRRYGVGGFAGTPKYGVQDFDMDLLAVHNAVLRAREGVNRLPEALRAKYADKARLIQDLALGDLILTEDGLSVAGAEVPQSGASDAGTSQAEGAAANPVT